MFGLFDAHLKQNVPHQVVPVSARDGPSPPFAVASADFRPLTGAGSRIKGNQSPTYVMCQSLMTAYVMSYPPWRACGGSDLQAGLTELQLRVRFNALAGVRGFGPPAPAQGWPPIGGPILRLICAAGRQRGRRSTLFSWLVSHQPSACAPPSRQRPDNAHTLWGVRSSGWTAFHDTIVCTCTQSANARRSSPPAAA